MIENLIATAFLSRDCAHRAHLSAKGRGSNAAHMALGAFYEGIIEAADALAEAYQGRNGLIKDIPFLAPDGEKDIVAELKAHLAAIERIRDKAVDPKDRPLQNLVDSLIATYLSVLYKLENLE